MKKTRLVGMQGKLYFCGFKPIYKDHLKVEFTMNPQWTADANKAFVFLDKREFERELKSHSTLDKPIRLVTEKL